MSNRSNKGLAAIIVASLLMGVIALPDGVKSKLPADRFSTWIKNQKITLGLDLQGGTQLDYRIDLRNVNAKNTDEDPDNDVKVVDVIEGVRNTIERRVNGLGVSEPNIYISSVADEQHIVVELAGIKDIAQAKAIVGKTIQLEFKEPKTEADAAELAAITKSANDFLGQARAKDADFKALAEAQATSDGKIDFRSEKTAFVSTLPTHYKDLLPKMKGGEVYKDVIKSTGEFMLGADGAVTEKTGLLVTQLLNREIKPRTTHQTDDFLEVAKELSTDKTVELSDQASANFDPSEAAAIWALNNGDTSPVIGVGETMRVYKMIDKKENGEQVKASHILFSYQGAEKAATDIQRTRDQAKKEAERVYEEVKQDPSKFGNLAAEYSNDPGSASQNGDLGYFDKGVMTKAFDKAAFSMEVGEISKVIETEFGFHIIQVNDKKPASEATVKLERIVLPASEESRAKLEDVIKRTTDGYDVTADEEEFTFNEVFFNTTPDPWKSTGLDGSHFRYASVVYNQFGAPEVSIQFDSEGGALFEALTERLVGKRMAIFVGGELISAPNVNSKIPGGSAVIQGSFNLQEALKLATDLNTGAIDAPVIPAGQYTISATLGENALRVSLMAGLIGIAFLAVFMLVYYRLLGLFALFALSIYAIIMVFVLKTTSIVMTLAGVAGVILSIGMAVDANILIFERTKEELNSGKNFSASIATGFERAWSSIRDSNASSLITCAILWFFGNSIIRGFALMLALGIIVSMFTAITVTRAFLQTMNGTGLSKNRWLLGAKKIELKHE